MLQMLKELGSAGNNISEVQADDLSNLRATVQMKDRAVELWLGDQNYQARYDSFARHYDEMRRNSEQPSIYDLRIDGRIFTR